MEDSGSLRGTATRADKNQDALKIEKKERILDETLHGIGKAAVAYSGGIDSHFLLTAAVRSMGKENVLAVLCRGVMLPGREAQEAEARLRDMGVRHLILDVDPLKIPEFASNDRLRCYYCKKNLMGMIREKANEHGFEVLLDGKNADDGKAYRPGAKAAEEIGVRSPLFTCGFTKTDIRACARKWGISIWNKPSQACLASRFPYDTALTAEELRKVERAEEILHDAGFAQCRVRVHDTLARIEVERGDLAKLLTCEKETGEIKKLGFSFVTMDLEGFQSGGYDK